MSLLVSKKAIECFSGRVALDLNYLIIEQRSDGDDGDAGDEHTRAGNPV